MAEANQLNRLRAVRLASASVTLLAVAALASFAAAGGTTKTLHTTVTEHTTVTKEKTVASATPPVSAPASSAATTLSPVAPTDSGAGAATEVVPGVSPPPATASGGTTPTPAVTTAATTPSTPAPAPAAAGDPTPSDMPTCPYPLAAPADPGGLQSLVSFAPLFGPFSSEAFAMAPLFQPFLQTVGPFLVAFANAYSAFEPSLAPLTTQVENLENEGFTFLSPFYGQYRSQFLSAESQLANALAPLATSLTVNPATSCLVDVEGLLTEAGGS